MIQVYKISTGVAEFFFQTKEDAEGFMLECEKIYKVKTNWKCEIIDVVNKEQSIKILYERIQEAIKQENRSHFGFQ